MEYHLNEVVCLKHNIREAVSLGESKYVRSAKKDLDHAYKVIGEKALSDGLIQKVRRESLRDLGVRYCLDKGV